MHDNPRALFYRLQDLGTRWLTPESSTAQDMMEKAFLEQFVEALPSCTKMGIKQHPNLTVNSAIDLACAFHRSPEFKLNLSKTQNYPGLSNVRPVPKGFALPRPMYKPNLSPPTQAPQCYNCNEWGHIARNYPRKATPGEPMEIGYMEGYCMLSGGKWAKDFGID